jgi:hypothetical protein
LYYWQSWFSIYLFILYLRIQSVVLLTVLAFHVSFYFVFKNSQFYYWQTWLSIYQFILYQRIQSVVLLTVLAFHISLTTYKYDWDYWSLIPHFTIFQLYCSSFIGWGYKCVQTKPPTHSKKLTKPPTHRKKLTNFIT